MRLPLAATVSLAHAHSPAGRIQRGGYKNATGELYCGARDRRHPAADDLSGRFVPDDSRELHSADPPTNTQAGG